MKVLILGCNGQVGWELQRALSIHGEVTALDRVTADLSNAASLARALDLHAADIVVNAAAYTAVDGAESEPDLADRINHRAVGEIAAHCAARGSWLMHYSTDYVFNGFKSGPYTEPDATDPRTAYGRSKRDGERVIAASGCRHLIFRTSWVHASRGGNFVRSILGLARERDSLNVVDDQHGAPTAAEFIADVTATAAAAIARAAPPEPGLYHLAAAGETTWHGFARFIVEEALACGAKLRLTPDAIAPIATADYPAAAARPANSVLATDKLRSALGITLPHWTLHARRTIVELVEKGM